MSRVPRFAGRSCGLLFAILLHASLFALSSSSVAIPVGDLRGGGLLRSALKSKAQKQAKKAGAAADGDVITDGELDQARTQLEGLLNGNAPRPPAMRLIKAGTLSEGGRWSVHGAEDPATGLLSLQVEGHFAGIPEEVMERCILDEAYQLDYDLSCVEKKVRRSAHHHYHHHHHDIYH